MKPIAVSIRQPWAHLLLSRDMPIANMDWTTAYRGDLLIHASRSHTRREWDKARHWIESHKFQGVDLPPMSELPVGAIVGRAKLTRVTQAHKSPWSQPGFYHWVFEEPEHLLPWEHRGQQGLFTASHPLATSPTHSLYPPFPW